MRILLDTTVLIDVLRGRPAADRRRELSSSAEPPYACAVNADEVWRGVREGERDAVERLLSALREAPLGIAEGRRAGEWRRSHARDGVTLSQADCLIAAAAVSVGATLATGNPHHFPMAELSVEHWPVGS
ncbi:MAG: PIN domain-containing protein [Solirubrobacterales bacterium]|nr:PIN domain-containing protein [Solirubrobacterales bacterium]